VRTISAETIRTEHKLLVMDDFECEVVAFLRRAEGGQIFTLSFQICVDI